MDEARSIERAERASRPLAGAARMRRAIDPAVRAFGPIVLAGLLVLTTVIDKAQASGPDPPEPYGAGDAAAPPRPAGGGAGESTSSLQEEIAAATADLDRGIEILAVRRAGPKRINDAVDAFGAAIERLGRRGRFLDQEGWRLLARAFLYRARARLQGGGATGADMDMALAVEADPSYLPDREEMPAKILERFTKIRQGRIAWVSVKADPPDAEVAWNGRNLGAASKLAAETPVVAGWFILDATAPCSEEYRTEGSLEAGESRALNLRLEPVGRDLLFQTVPAGFDVEVDGTLSGLTAAGVGAAVSQVPGAPATQGESSPRIVDAGPAGDEPGREGTRSSGAEPGRGELVVRCLSAGDHSWVVRRDCFEEERGSSSIVIDLLDRSPQALPVLTPRRREARLSVETDTQGSRVQLDGTSIGPAPVREVSLCPGRKRLEIRTNARLVWSGTIDLPDGTTRIEAGRRPVLRILIAEADAPGALPAKQAEAVRARAQGLSTFNQAASAAGDAALLASLSRPPEPGRMKRPGFDADLVLVADRPPKGVGASIRLRLVSDSGVEDESVCGGADAACLEMFFEGMQMPWPPALTGTGLASVRPPGSASAPASRLAAISELDSALLAPCEPRNASLLNLASALLGKGDFDLALDLALEKAGFSDKVRGAAALGTVRYLAGLSYTALGLREQAFGAFRRAASDESATLWEPDGLPVAPMARLALKAFAAQ